MKLNLDWFTRQHQILPSLILVSLTSIAANLLVSLAVLVAFRSITNASGGTELGPIERVLDSAPINQIDPALLVVVAIGVLVVVNNLTAQLETSLLRQRLGARAKALEPTSDRQGRARQSAYLSSLRPLYGSLFSLGSELSKLLIFTLVAAVFFFEVAGVWSAVCIALTGVLMRIAFTRGARIFSNHRGVRSGSDTTAKTLADSLVSIESNAAVLPISNLLAVLVLALLPIMWPWFVYGDLATSGTTWIPVWLLLISSATNLIRHASALGLHIARNSEYRVSNGMVLKNGE